DHYADREVLEIEQSAGLSVGEAEMHDVAIAHDIILAFEPELAGLARPGLALAGDVILIGDGLGADVALLEIGVDDARRFRPAAAGLDRPGARLFRPDGEKGH